MITEVMMSLQKIVEKVVLRKVCLGEMGEGLPSLGYWLRLSESVLEKVAVVSKCHHVKKKGAPVYYVNIKAAGAIIHSILLVTGIQKFMASI